MSDAGRFAPGRLWSLLDIMEALRLGVIVQTVHDLVSSTSFGTDDNAPMHPNHRSTAKLAFERLLGECDLLGLIVEPQKIDFAIEILERPPAAMETGLMARTANDVISTINMELKGRSFLSVSPEKKRFFEPSIPLFGAEFDDRFSSAKFELDEAGKCLALGRATAAVFHLIRIMEIGVRSVARCLAIPDPIKGSERNWSAVLRQIKSGMTEKWPTEASRNSGDGAFFESVHASLDAVRNPWRNATMHIESKYTQEEAESIFAAVRGFMMKLASRCDEDGLPQAA